MAKQGMHLDQFFREKLFATFSFMDSVNELQQIEGMKELFGPKEWGWLKAAGTNVEKCFRHLLENLDHDEREKFIKLIKQNYVMVVSKAEKKKEKASLEVQPKHLWDLAEIAIENHCTGCQIKKYKACRVYNRLMKAYIPAAQNTNIDCPYRQ